MERFYQLVILPLFLIVFASCSPSPEDYAVVLWPENDSSLQPGDVLPIFGTSEIDDALLYELEDTEGSIPPWRVLRFPEETEAQEYSAEYAEWSDTYARSLRTALPVRERADRTSARVYRLRDGELVKVLGRQAEISDEAGLEDYWYEVLTREGISGWVFGYHLEITGASGRSLDPTEEHDDIDRIVSDIASISWRPQYFNDMVASGRIDLRSFSPRFGFFGVPDEEAFRLVLPDVERRFDYTGYFSSDGRLIEFEGVDLIIELTSQQGITVRYSVNGRQRTSDFVLFEKDINLIIESEQERRNSQLESFLERGNGLISTAYGTMRLTDRGAITWTGFQRLVPGVLPSSFSGSGRLEFDLYLDDELRGRYDGATTLISPAGQTRFLYTFTDDGVRFVYVPASNVTNDGIVAAEPISPVVIFFRFVRE